MFARVFVTNTNVMLGCAALASHDYNTTPSRVVKTWGFMTRRNYDPGMSARQRAYVITSREQTRTRNARVGGRNFFSGHGVVVGVGVKAAVQRDG
jgi:hypothetical protein